MRNVAFALVIAVAAGATATACLMTIDEGRIPCATCDAGAPHDAAADSTMPMPVDATSPGVRCGTGTCVGLPVCCVQTLGDNDYRKGACNTSLDCQTGDYFECTRPTECAATASCCIVVKGGAFTRTECASSCPGAALCDPGGAACAGGKSCLASADLPGLFECR